jgi:hypothetical protein
MSNANASDIAFFSRERLERAEVIKIRSVIRMTFNFVQIDSVLQKVLQGVDPQKLIEIIKINSASFPDVIERPSTEGKLDTLLVSFRYKGKRCPNNNKKFNSMLETRFDALLEIEDSYPMALELGGFIGGGFNGRKDIPSVKKFAELMDGGRQSKLHELLADANKLESSHRQFRTFIRHILGFFYQKKLYKCLERLGLIPENLKVGTDSESQLKAFFGDKVKYTSEMREPMLKILKKADVDGIWNNFVHRIWGHEYVEALGIVKYYLCRRLYN